MRRDTKICVVSLISSHRGQSLTWSTCSPILLRCLIGSTHNNLRISRILKCLSEFGLEHLNAGFLLHVLNEQSEHGELNTYSISSSMDSWWANCIRNEDERNWISQTIREARSDVNPLVFTRDMYESALRRREIKGSLKEETS